MTKELSGYNKVASVGLFKKGIHPALAWKLVEIGQLRNSDSVRVTGAQDSRRILS